MSVKTITSILQDQEKKKQKSAIRTVVKFRKICRWILKIFEITCDISDTIFYSNTYKVTCHRKAVEWILINWLLALLLAATNQDRWNHRISLGDVKFSGKTFPVKIFPVQTVAYRALMGKTIIIYRYGILMFELNYFRNLHQNYFQNLC